MPSAAKITAGELVLVCSRYDLGAIRSLRRFRGGSRQAPKVLIESDRGLFLLKRRAPSPGDPMLAHRVALSHEVQLFLQSRGFPVAPLVGTRQTGPDAANSILELNGYIYEMFGFIRGRRYDRSRAAAHEAGRQLARLHTLLDGFTPAWSPPTTTYHAHPAVTRTLADLPARLNDSTLASVCTALATAYERARDRAVSLGVNAASMQLVHGDWHPGNLLFADSPTPISPVGAHPAPAHPPAIAAVLDFDSVRIGAPLLDLANAAFQFSVSRNAEPEAAKPATPRILINADAFGAFYQGYKSGSADQGLRNPRSVEPELGAVPWLMIEAMVVETAAPIAATGRFGKLGAGTALAMTARAVEWVAAEQDRLVSLARGP